jgi:hypothetical protein
MVVVMVASRHVVFSLYNSSIVVMVRVQRRARKLFQIAKNHQVEKLFSTHLTRTQIL